MLNLHKLITCSNGLGDEDNCTSHWQPKQYLYGNCLQFSRFKIDSLKLIRNVILNPAESIRLQNQPIKSWMRMKCDLNSLLLSMILIQLLVGFSFSWEQLCTFQVKDAWTIIPDLTTNHWRSTVYRSGTIMHPYLSTVEQTLDPMYSLNLSPMKTPSIGYRQGNELILNPCPLLLPYLKNFVQNKLFLSERNTTRFALRCG